MPAESPSRPNRNTYWVVPLKFLAGEYPGDVDRVKARKKLNHFLAAGVRHFVDLNERGELTECGKLVPYDSILSEEARNASTTVTYQRFPIRDNSVPRDSEHLAEILFAIDRRIREGGVVYLHCWGGVGRTGLVVACWLQEHGRTPDDALAELSAKWSTVEKIYRKPKSPETPTQVDWVRTWPQRRRGVQQLMLCDRYRGALLGLAVGDALGTTLEFKAPGTFKPIADMIGVLAEQKKSEVSPLRKSVAPVIERLKAWRAANNLSQSQAVHILLAAGLPAKVRTLQVWEIGRHSPQPITSAALERFLNEHPKIDPSR